MKPDIVKALETRLEWLHWAKTDGAEAWAEIRSDSARVLPQFIANLEMGETFYMDPHFCRLVDHARRTVPDTTRWDSSVLIRPHGWMYMAEPVLLPDLLNRKAIAPNLAEGVKMSFRAVGWRSFEPGQRLVSWNRGTPEGFVREDNPNASFEYTLDRPATHFLTYQAFSDYKGTVMDVEGQIVDTPRAGFGHWSYFLLRQGDELGERVREFEEWTRKRDAGGQYEPRDEHPLHEMRWIYTAFHLMNQRLALPVRHDTDRATRRRAERREWKPQPFVTCVTLRRLQAAREQAAVPSDREWHWQWEVRGHWRNQWYRGERVHKPKFIEAYIKGPADKPFKEPPMKLFVARR